jgi:hypothetical protein
MKAIEKKIFKIKTQMMVMGDLRPGNLTKQFNVCGNPTCRCKDPVKPKKHGPYYNLSYSFGGKSKTQFIRPEMAKEVKAETNNYRKFKKLMQMWITLEIEKSNLQIIEKKEELDRKN